jgi:hypothetical protein
MVLDICCFRCIGSHACFLQKALLKNSPKEYPRKMGASTAVRPCKARVFG